MTHGRAGEQGCWHRGGHWIATPRLGVPSEPQHLLQTSHPESAESLMEPQGLCGSGVGGFRGRKKTRAHSLLHVAPN